MRTKTCILTFAFNLIFFFSVSSGSFRTLYFPWKNAALPTRTELQFWATHLSITWLSQLSVVLKACSFLNGQMLHALCARLSKVRVVLPWWMCALFLHQIIPQLLNDSYSIIRKKQIWEQLGESVNNGVSIKWEWREKPIYQRKFSSQFFWLRTPVKGGLIYLMCYFV